jgi:hypothetical protein
MSEASSKYWIVTRHGGKGPHSNGKLYESHDDADLAAIEMAGRHPGVRYVVLETVGHIEVPPPELVRGAVQRFKARTRIPPVLVEREPTPERPTATSTTIQAGGA